jgi:rhamnosyltransferase
VNPPTSPARPSVIIRTRDSAATLAQVIHVVRAQTVQSEIVVVDSGSVDDSLAIADASADVIVRIPSTEFTFGRALNLGAHAASGDIHFALSSHAFPPDEAWLERSLAKYERADVAGTAGAPMLPGGRERLRGTFYQTLGDALAFPAWGFSNTGASWRAAVWREHPFDQRLAACEDKDWGFRVLSAGWVLAIDPTLCVGEAHKRTKGLRHLYRRTRREYAELCTFAFVGPYSAADCFDQWLNGVPSDARARGWRTRLNCYRTTELIAKHRALAQIRGRVSQEEGYRPALPAPD